MVDVPAICAKANFKAKALLLGERLDLRALGETERLATSPLTIAVRGGGTAVLFRYGAVVLFDVAPLEQTTFLKQLHPFVIQPYAENETEEAAIRISTDAKEGIEADAIYLRECAVERLQIVADILSRSVVLATYESRMAKEFDKIEAIASNLERTSRGGNAKELLRFIGAALLSEHRMVGRAEINDKPELIWDKPDLERLFLRLEDAYEISERYSALERKLDLITHTAQTGLELIQNRRSLRVEWYVVALIVMELIVSLIDLYFRK